MNETVVKTAEIEPFTGNVPVEAVEGGVRAQNRALVTQSLAALLARSQFAVDSERRWQEEANCLGVDPDIFFPERGASTREAKACCRSCEVRVDCLEYALVHGERFGIWGGLTERERRRVRRQRRVETLTQLQA